MAMSNDQKENLERIQLRELDVDYSLKLVENHYADELGISWVDVINFVDQKARENIMRLRIKELFLVEFVDEKLLHTNDDKF